MTNSGPLTLASQPNVLVIVADDLGYADVGFNGCRDIATSHLDALARRSVRCTSGYVTFPVCSPSRAGLLTGRHQARFGHETNLDWAPHDPSIGLPVDQVLLSAVLKASGYRTGCIGKWHLGGHPVFHPNRRGFDEFFGMLHGGHMYLPAKVTDNPYTHPLNRNGQPEVLQEHITELFAREASEFLERHRNSPWFLYLAFNAPHGPLQSTPELLRRASHIDDDLRRPYAALVLGLDDAIGEVIDALDRTGQRDNTLIFFISDNGGTPVSHSDNSPLRGSKGSLFEGGIRVPFLVSWPGRLPQGSDYAAPVSTLDIFATSAAVSQSEASPDLQLEGANLIPFLSGEETAQPHDYLFWRKPGGAARAVRQANWKLLQLADEPARLYDLQRDIGESNDLASSEPQIVERLSQAYEKWNRENVEPLPLVQNRKPRAKSIK